MKSLRLLFAVLILSLACGVANAQSKDSTEYFVGSWNVLVKGLPSGDTKMFVNLQKTDSSYSGAILDSTQKEVAKFSKVERKGFTVTVYFEAQGYDVTLFLEKKDEDHVAGNMLNMFDAVGDRVKDK
ncbi:MAG: hypothetical protein QM764_10130 [Chitinophagaceae bacterium]